MDTISTGFIRPNSTMGPVSLSATQNGTLGATYKKDRWQMQESDLPPHEVC
jgi:hypothetical protein